MRRTSGRPRFGPGLATACSLVLGSSACGTASTETYGESAPPAAYPGSYAGASELPALGDPALGQADPAAAPGPQAAAEPEPYANLYRRAGLDVGAAFLANFDTTVQVTGDSGAGAILDLEDFLNVDDDYLVARLDAFYAFSPRHRLDLGIFDIRRDGTETIGQNIQIGDVVIPAGDVKTTIQTLVVKAAYRYNFVTDTRTTLGASFGFHTLGLDLAFESEDFNVSEKFRATAPLPVLGLHGAYALSERWKLAASAELFQIDLGFAEGFLADNRLALEHDPFDFLGWGIALNGFQLDAEIEDDSLTGDIEYAYQGVFLYLRVYL